MKNGLANIHCPLDQGGDDPDTRLDPCGAEMTVEVTPGSRGNRDEPPTGPYIEAISGDCPHAHLFNGHGLSYQDESDILKAAAAALEERTEAAYETEMQARIDRARGK